MTSETNPEPETQVEEPKKRKTKAKPKATDLTLAELCERYVAHLEKVGKSNGTVFSYSAELKLACTELGRDTKIAAITPEQMQAFYDCERVTKLRSGRPKANASVAKSRRVIRLALCYALEKKWIEKVPLPDSEATY
jgi:hypothetical protein